MTTRRTLLAAAVGSGLLAVAGCSALTAQGESRLTAIPTPTPTGPAVSASSAASGPLSGGTQVTLTGANLAGVVAVTVGTVAASAVAVTDDTSLVFTTPSAADYVPVTSPITLTLGDGTTVDTGQTYSFQALTPVDAQLQYAFTYWENYNLDEWGRFPDNDCGNFVNQTLIARGWTQNDAWYSDFATTGDYNFSWIRGNEMDEYLLSRDDTTNIDFADRNQAKVGDVVMFDWDPDGGNGVDHTMLISAVIPQPSGVNAIKLVGHTVDAKYRDFDEAITKDNPGGTAHFISIA